MFDKNLDYDQMILSFEGTQTNQIHRSWSIVLIRKKVNRKQLLGTYKEDGSEQNTKNTNTNA